jgi:hypothetical protein
MSSSTKNKEVITAVQDAVISAALDSTTVDDDNSGGCGDLEVGRETKGNYDDTDAMVDDKNKSSADDVIEKGGASKVIVGGGIVVG